MWKSSCKAKKARLKKTKTAYFLLYAESSGKWVWFYAMKLERVHKSGGIIRREEQGTQEGREYMRHET